MTLTGALWPAWRVWTVDADRGIPAELRNALYQGAGVTADAIAAAALEPIGTRVAARRPRDQGAWPWIVPLSRRGGRTSARQYCPACLSEDATPHYRIGWRLAWHTGCARHGRSLVDRCARCGATQQLQHLRADAWHVATCTACGTELRDSPAGACHPDALKFQQAGDGVIEAGVGRCFGRKVDAAQWFAVADFLCSLVRQTVRSPTKGLNVRGDSMDRTGVRDKDVIAVAKTTEAKSGDVVVARFGDEVTVKRFVQIDERHVELRPESTNPAHEVLKLDLAKHVLDIDGVVVGALIKGLRDQPSHVPVRLTTKTEL